MSLSEKDQNTEIISLVLIIGLVLMGFFKISIYWLIPVAIISGWNYARIRHNVALQFERNFIGALITIILSQAFFTLLFYGIGFGLNYLYTQIV